MSVICLFTIILAILMITSGGGRGASSFVYLLLDFIVMFITILLMTADSHHPMILTCVDSVAISAINLLFSNKVNSKTVTAFIATIITISLLVILIHFVTKKTMIQGFSEENIDELSVYSLLIGVDFVKVATSVIIMSTIGAITDMAISITLPIQDIFQNNKNISQKELFT